MASALYKAGLILIGLGLGMVIKISFSGPMSVLNNWLWLIPLILGIILIIKD